MDEVLKRDQNRIVVLGGITDDSDENITMLRVDPTTKRLMVSATGLPGTGDVEGPASATDNAVVRFNGTTGKLIQNSGVIVGDNDGITTSIATGNGVVISGATTGNLLSLAPSGSLGNNSGTSGAFLMDMSDASGIAFQIYTDSAGAGLTYPQIFIAADNNSYAQPLIQLRHLGTSGNACIFRLDGPSPQIEWRETDNSGAILADGEGQFEQQVQGDIFFINGRNHADTSFENSVWFLRPDTTAGMNGNVGIGVNPYGIEKLTIGATTGGAPRLALGETTAPTADAGYGKFYVKSSDSLPYFMTGGGTEYSLTSGNIWVEVTGTTQAGAVNTDYILNNAGTVTLTIPTTAPVGSTIRVVGKGAGGWVIAQNASEIIHFGSSATTTGTGGSLASTNRYDAVELVCIVANTEWSVVSSQGNITVT